MAQQQPPLKSILYNQLKQAAEYGVYVEFAKPYVNYTVDELQELVERYLPDPARTQEYRPEQPPVNASAPRSAPVPPEPTHPAQGQRRPEVELVDDSGWEGLSPNELADYLGVPYSNLPAERAGLTFNTHKPDDPLRVDFDGRVWFQDEVMKPAIPKRRMVRAVRYQDTGVKTVERRTEDGHLDERFEVSGDQAREMEVKITLPSWQVGIYKDPRLPFRVHVYNGVRGFSWSDIVIHYGGMDLVPSTIKRLYVGQDLCFDIRSTRETMEREYRDLQLGRSFE